jgi:hypothetical protein
MGFTPYVATIGNIVPPLPVSDGGTGLATDGLPPFIASDTALLAWNYDPVIAINATALATGGEIQLCRVNVRQAITVTNVLYVVTAAGGTLTTNENFAGLYNSSGTLVGSSADQTSAWEATTGLYTNALSGGPYALAAGFYWVAFVVNGTTAPTLIRAGNNGVPAVNLGLSNATSRFAHTATSSQTSLTGFTPSGNVQTAISTWVGLS